MTLSDVQCRQDQPRNDQRSKQRETFLPNDQKRFFDCRYYGQPFHTPPPFYVSGSFVVRLKFAPTRGRGRWTTEVRRFSPVAVGCAVSAHSFVDSVTLLFSAPIHPRSAQSRDCSSRSSPYVRCRGCPCPGAGCTRRLRRPG